MKRTLVRGGTVVTPSGVRPAHILIEGSRIAALIEADSAGLPPADEVIDAGGLIVLPGAIDAHTHFVQDDPDLAVPSEIDYEGFTNGGRGALAGGVTTVVEMPQSSPPTRDGSTFKRKRELAECDALVDFALWGGIVPDQREHAIWDQVELGAVGFKAFMCDSDPTYPGIDDAQLLAALQALKDTPLMLGLHAESDALLQAGKRRMQALGRTDPLAHAESRPSIVEIEAVHRAIFFAEHTGGWVHIVHMSTPGAAELIRQAKARGVRVTCETCPQYLALDLDDLIELGPYAKCAPAIRSRSEVEALWDYLADGTIDCITSDHCGFTAASKEAGRSNIWNAPDGLCMIQTLLPVTVTEARRRGFGWDRIAEWLSTAPARLWQIAPQKGAILPDADADLVLLDSDRDWTVSASDLLHAQPWSPFEGRAMRGRVLRTLVRGETLYRDDVPERVLAQPGFGRFIPAQSH